MNRSCAELRAISSTNLLPKNGQRWFQLVESPSAWDVFSKANFEAFAKEAVKCKHPDGPTVHFFQDEKPVYAKDKLKEAMKSGSWVTTEELEELLRQQSFSGTVRVTQLHNLDSRVYDTVSSCIQHIEEIGFGPPILNRPPSSNELMRRFHNRHGGVNAYFSMQDSQRAIPFHRDPGDVFAFQAYGSKVWDIGSSSTLDGGGYADQEDAKYSVEAKENTMLFIPRGIRHRAKVSRGSCSLHFVLMLDTSPEFWALSGIIEAIKDIPFFAKA